MPETFLIADTHFGHANILRYEAANRPFTDVAAHDAALIARWNARVGPRDTVWVLGDFAWSAEAARAALGALKGRIHLVMGDHDRRWLGGDGLGFDALAEVHGAVKFAPGTLLSHVPALLGPKYARNVHGHTHSRSVGDGAHVCVSVEHTGLAPLTWEEVRARFRDGE
ncbi:MAG: metallophosphoesterase [Rhodovibrio sp.]|nr:metallophosphoesterase [Rhodovibrio sp.]